MPNDVKQTRSLLGGLSYHRQYLPLTARHIRPITGLLKKGAPFVFTAELETVVCQLLSELAAPPVLV